MAEMTHRPVEVERQGRVAIIRYSDPPLHTIRNSGAALIDAALNECLADDSIRVIVLTGGSADVFIRHADVAQIARAADALADGLIEPASFVDAPFPRLMRTLDNAEKPVIAAINGTCMGGGLEIALGCTMRIAASRVDHIGLPEIRIDIFPGSGGTQRLWRLLGWHRARLFMLRGEVVNAARAASLGLVDEVVESALDRAIEVAQELATRNPGAVAAILRLTRVRDADAGLNEELLTFAALLRDDPAVRARLARFVQEGERLDRLP